MMADELCCYPTVCRNITARILTANPEAHSREGDENDVEHTLWMIEQLQFFTRQDKIDRWLGWILSKAHTMGLLTLKEAHDLAHRDRLQASK